MLQSSRHSSVLLLLLIGVALQCELRLVSDAVADEKIEPAKYAEDPISENSRFHWSFAPLKRPSVPTVQAADWTRNPIDCFIAKRLEDAKLLPAYEADRVTLIRRLSFDLTGLPPTPEAIDKFVADRSPDAYEQLVEQLLTSHLHGERWGQHWLDLARFAETDGFEHDKMRDDAWKYRDWVIDALNSDLPYSRFVTLQLAGDEIAPENPASPTATAFCLSGPDMPDINSMEERKHNLLNELTATVGATLLGLQFGCAQCHDHKYDPISQGDFYRLRAVFQPAVQVQKNKSVSVLGESGATIKPSYLMVRGDWRRPGPELGPDFPRIANPNEQPFAPKVLRTKSSGRRLALANWLTQDDHVLIARVIVNRLWQHHFGEGLSRTPSDFGIMGDEPSHPELLDWLATELVRSDWSLKHIHRLIVTSATYRQASRPTDPTDFEDASVPLKKWEQRIAADPTNRMFSRFSRRRLEGEVIRDAMLAAAGVLNSHQGGPGVRPPLPEELRITLLKGQWDETADRSQHDRRSIYIFARRNLRYPIFEAFDRPDGNATCPRRDRSTTAPQSLLMLNSQYSLDAARRIAGLVLSGSGTLKPADESAAIRLAFRRMLGRLPLAEETQLASDFLRTQAMLLREEARKLNTLALPQPSPSELDPPVAAAFVDLCLGLLNSNEFIYVD